jgi:hypothetical protein
LEIWKCRLTGCHLMDGRTLFQSMSSNVSSDQSLGMSGSWRWDFKMRYPKSLDFRLDSGSSWLDGVNGILIQQEPNSPKQDYWNWRAIASLANTLITVVEPVPMPLLSSMLLLQL